MRRNSQEIARQALEWNPQGSRRQGRPRQTWRRSILDEAGAEGKQWEEVKVLAQNRVLWRNFLNATCARKGKNPMSKSPIIQKLAQ